MDQPRMYLSEIQQGIINLFHKDAPHGRGLSMLTLVASTQLPGPGQIRSARMPVQAIDVAGMMAPGALFHFDDEDRRDRDKPKMSGADSLVPLAGKASLYLAGATYPDVYELIDRAFYAGEKEVVMSDPDVAIQYLGFTRFLATDALIVFRVSWGLNYVRVKVVEE